MRALISFLPRDTAANALTATVDSRLLLFAFLVSVAAGLLSGFAPALHAGRKSLISSLRDRSGSGFGDARLRKVIVTVQIAFSLVLVIGAVLFVRTLTGLLAKGPGFETGSLISFGLDPRRNGYPPSQATQVIRRIFDDVRASPVSQTSAMASMQLLTGGASSDPMTIQTDRRFATDRDVNLNSVTPGFFATLGIRIIAGRDFDEHDAPPVRDSGGGSAIVNEAFVKRYLNGRNPLGVRICQGSGPDARPSVEIVGVMADFSYRGLREESEQAYFPISKSNQTGATFYVKAHGAPDPAFQAIRTIVRNADPALPISSMRTLDEQVSRSLNAERMLAMLSGAFGMLALLLSLIGLYGVMSFVVTRRTREIGIRIALGASGGSAIWLILREAVAMIAAGTAIALPCVWALGRLVESQLFGVRATDSSAILEAILLLGMATLGAALIPAYHASTVDPSVALRLD
jgi:predicted permease